MNTSLQVRIASTKNPQEAWETLQKQFESVSITHIVRLNRKFYAAAMEEGGNLMEHLTMMTSLSEQLKKLKEDVSPKKFATVVLGSLPESYDVISSFNARSSDELDWDNINGLLIEDYMKRKEKTERQSSSSNDALFMKKAFSSSRGRSNQQRGRYMRSTSREENRGPKCYKCKLYGHIAKNCPQKKHGHSNIAVSNEADKVEEQLPEFDEMALSSKMNWELKNCWFVDSGATKHMIFQKDLILIFTKYSKPSKIYLGDNRFIFCNWRRNCQNSVL